MKKILAITTMSFLLQNHVFSQSIDSTVSQYNRNDSIAHTIICINLEEVKKFIGDKKNPDFFDIGNVVWFLTNLTSIPPKSYYSKNAQNINIEDYEKWQLWYELNKGNVYWDDKKNQILIRKSVKSYVPFNRQ